MNIQSINIEAAAQQTKADAKLSEACEKFEGLLMGMILKDSLASSQFSDNEEPGSGLMKEFASEQLAQSLSKDGGIGLADMLYREMSTRKGKTL
jgi:flagellar protein FlgJ